MKGHLLFAAGVLISGYLGYTVALHTLASDKAKAEAPAQVTAARPTVTPKAATPKVVQAVRPSPRPAEAPGAFELYWDEDESENSAERKADDALSFILPLQEEAIRELESAFRDLTARIGYVVTTDEGWELHLDDPNSPFASMGFKDGDLITFDSIDHEFRVPGRTPLVSRFVAILAAMKRQPADDL